MIIADLEKSGKLGIEGSGDVLIAEICTILRVLLNEMKNKNEERYEYAKAVIIDQIENGFDPERLDLYEVGKKGSIVC